MLLTRGSLTSRLMPSDLTTPISEKMVRKFGRPKPMFDQSVRKRGLIAGNCDYGSCSDVGPLPRHRTALWFVTKVE
jgi:hypothetical protein